MTVLMPILAYFSNRRWVGWFDRQTPGAISQKFVHTVRSQAWSNRW